MSQSEVTCPLCLESLDSTEKDFFPCSCGYQICAWCFHSITEKLDAKCPACRQNYSSEVLSFATPNAAVALPHQTILPNATSVPKRQKKKNATKTTKTVNSKAVKKPLSAAEDSPQPLTNPHDGQALQDVRVVQKNLVYVVGLPPAVADEFKLKSPKLFGRWGKIVEVKVAESVGFKNNGDSEKRFSAFITFDKQKDAEKALYCTQGSILMGHVLRASYGTTKYCGAFRRGEKCTKPLCLFLHEWAKPEDCVSLEELRSRFNKNSSGVAHTFGEVPKHYKEVSGAAASDEQDGADEKEHEVVDGVDGAEVEDEEDEEDELEDEEYTEEKAEPPLAVASTPTDHSKQQDTAYTNRHSRSKDDKEASSKMYKARMSHHSKPDKLQYVEKLVGKKPNSTTLAEAESTSVSINDSKAQTARASSPPMATATTAPADQSEQQQPARLEIKMPPSSYQSMSPSPVEAGEQFMLSTDVNAAEVFKPSSALSPTVPVIVALAQQPNTFDSHSKISSTIMNSPFASFFQTLSPWEGLRLARNTNTDFKSSDFSQTTNISAPSQKPTPIGPPKPNRGFGFPSTYSGFGPLADSNGTSNSNNTNSSSDSSGFEHMAWARSSAGNGSAPRF